MNKVVINSLQGSVFIQTVLCGLAIYILQLLISYSVRQKLLKSIGTRQNYYNNKQAYFLWPTLYGENLQNKTAELSQRRPRDAPNI